MRWVDMLPVSQAGSIGGRRLLEEALSLPLSSPTAGAIPSPLTLGSSPQAQRTKNHRTPRPQELLGTRDSACLSNIGETEAW